MSVALQPDCRSSGLQRIKTGSAVAKMKVVHDDEGAGNRTFDSSSNKIELRQMDVTRPIHIKSILPALDLDSGLFWRDIAGREKIEGVGWSADSLDIEEIFSLLIEGIEVVPEKIGICFCRVSTRFTKGAVAKSHGTLSGLSDDASVTKYSPSGAGINPGPSPTVACAVWESPILVGCGKKSALVGRLRPGGRGIVGGTLRRGHALPIKVKGHGSIRPAGDLLWRPVDQDTGFPKAEAILRGELDFENWSIVSFPNSCAVDTRFNDGEGRNTDLGWVLARVVGLVANRGMRSSAPPEPDRFAVDTLVKKYGIACLSLEFCVGDGREGLGEGSGVGVVPKGRGGDMKLICCLRQDTGCSEEN